MTRLERPIREFLSDWHVWVGIAYFGLAAVVVALFVLFNRTAHEEAARAASVRAAAATQVGQCFTAVKNAPIVHGFIDAHEAIIDNGLISNRAALDVTPHNSPLYMIRLNSIRRLRQAKDNADQLRHRISRTTPTRGSCIKLAHRLSVDPSRYLTPTH